MIAAAFIDVNNCKSQSFIDDRAIKNTMIILLLAGATKFRCWCIISHYIFNKYL